MYILSVPSCRRWIGPAWRALGRLGGAVALAVLPLLILALPASAREVSVRGAEMNRFGRIVLEFDRATKVTARQMNGILVLGFGEPARIRNERLATEMPSYVATVRQDPDQTGLRLALTTPYRLNVMEAAEKVFIDLLPETWTGLLPSLPPEVVADLARRAQEAEARAKAEALRREVEVAKPVRARVASLPNLTRIVFEPPGVVPIQFAVKGNEASVLFDGLLSLDRTQIAGQLAPAVRAVTADETPSGLLVRLVIEAGYEARGFREDEAFVLDVAKPATASPAPTPPPSVLAASGAGAKAAEPKSAEAKLPAKSPDPKPAPRPEAAADAEGSGRWVAQPKAAAPVALAPAPFSPSAPAGSAGPVQPVAVVSGEGLRLSFPFAGRVAAAAYERAGLLHLVFHTNEPIALTSLPPEAEAHLSLREVVREGAFAIVRLALPKPQIARLAPQERGWVLTLGESHLAPAQPLSLARTVDDVGRTVITVPLPDSSGVYWMEETPGGERVAVVTAFGAPRNIAKHQRFVEFALLPTVQGLAVTASADDVVVRSGLEGVTIARGSGLSVSLAGTDRDAEAATAARPDPVIRRDAWREAQSGSVQDRVDEALRAAASVPRSQRSQARLDLAQALLANDLAHEALTVLAYAGQDDPILAAQRPFLLLRGVASLKAGRLPEAQAALAEPILGDDPEGILWRASLDAARRRWPQALTGFRRSSAALDLYPENLQVPLRLQAAQAGLEVRDFVYADSELASASSAAGADGRGELTLLRARLDEALGRPEVALDVYRRLAESAERPVAARATLHWVELALRQRAMPPTEAIPLLETLAVTWRGDDVEVGALGRLGRLYAEAGRWREAFFIARRANQIFTDHPATRALHDETARLFEDLFLSGKGETLSRVDSLALYFDFREFTPIGRRGDEIVRRLADRLVELDLLDQAGSLLQHQVDNRLFGAARATVAARLATVRLMDGKPAQALQALRATRLPELPQAVNRARLLLEARALSDLSRTDLALEILQGEAGPEIERLRADILWSGRRWREAGEAHERLVGTRWQAQAPLSDADRTDVLRAAIAFSLADEALALDRIRAKFSAKMADSTDARTFAFLTQPQVTSTRAFRELARRVTGADTLSDFLSEYRKRYPEAAAAERPRRPLPPEPPQGADAARS